jgi:hypothetical protein
MAGVTTPHAVAFAKSGVQGNLPIPTTFPSSSGFPRSGIATLYPGGESRRRP